MVLAAFAVAFALFGLWQFLVGVVRLFRRNSAGGALEAVTLIGALVFVVITPLMMLSQATTTAA